MIAGMIKTDSAIAFAMMQVRSVGEATLAQMRLSFVLVEESIMDFITSHWFVKRSQVNQASSREAKRTLIVE